jgi:predicted ABC-type transport system involved in lysophospholipase L1 biosynthesis ATPase subunit
VGNVLLGAMTQGLLGRRAPAERRERARELLAAFGLGQRLRHKPAQLSGGERQRVAIARALIADPPLLLADEPTGNLDQHTGESILDALEKVVRPDNSEAPKRTMLMVTHDRQVARRADRIVHMVDGVIVEGALAASG